MLHLAEPVLAAPEQDRPDPQAGSREHRVQPAATATPDAFASRKLTRVPNAGVYSVSVPGVDTAIHGLPEHAQRELRQLFALLASGLWIGLALLGVAWIGMELFTSRPAGVNRRSRGRARAAAA